MNVVLTDITAAIVFYEHLITISLEVEHIWRRGFSIVTALFAANRALLLATRILVLYGNWNTDPVVGQHFWPYAKSSLRLRRGQ